VQDADVLVRTSEPPRLRVVERLRELGGHREILVNLVRKELKVRYATSALGVAWSMLNPLLYLAVFGVVFTFFLPAGIEDFPAFLLSGLVAWTLFSTATGQATVSIVGNANLVSKVAFPREILPLSTVGASLVNFGFQLVVLVGFVAIVRPGALAGWHVALLPLSLAVLLVFTTAMAFLVSAVNVRYRDTQHLVELGLLAWFWMTPIVYAAGLIADKAGDRPGLFDLYLLNPMADIVMGFQRALYGNSLMTGGRGFGSEGVAVLPEPGIAWYAARLGIVGAASVVLLYVTWRMFFHRSGDFAEEL
jgi:ABC-2 type transport system permease protein